jgi:peptidoglycan/LPS O-acetylase OafA/YrhL
MQDSRYRADIDGLRALAILGVVAFHIGLPYITGGYAGVDVFFVVSGFLITRLLTGEHARTGAINLAHFYERRARRLLPALSVVVLATLVFGYFLLPFANAHSFLGRSAMFTLLFAANRFFRLYVGGYFQDSAGLMPLAHTWSLGVEEQFYLFYPLALILFFRFTPKARWGWLKSVAVAVTAASFALSVVLTHGFTIRAFYWAPSRAWELGVGALVALWFADEPAVRPLQGTLLGLGGLVAIAVAFVTLTPASAFPGALALAPVLGTAAMIIAVPLSPRSILARTLSSQPLVSLGRVSYAWYLWHWPILVIARRWRLGDPDIRADAGWVLMALALAILTTRFIERPFRRRTDESPAARRRFFRLAALCTAALFALAFVVYESDRIWPDRVPRVDAQPPPFPCLAATFTDTLTFGRCATPPPSEPAAIAVWGDSHAAAWSPAVWTLGDSEHVTVYELSGPGCAPLIGLRVQRPGQVKESCSHRNAAEAAWLRSEIARDRVRDRVRGVILVARWPRYVQGAIDPRNTTPLVDSRDAAPWSSIDSVRASLERTLAFTDSMGLRALILLTPPEFKYSLSECAIVRALSRCGISRAEADAYRGSSVELARSVARAHPNVRVVDPIGFFCDSLYCPAETHGVLAARDGSHVSASAARAFAPFLREDFLWLVAGR